eukprot:TRINITY_DN30120_c0_g1_i1.p1 TRINITY_DN30120_c0_g1~~TRINITY_DN30120_c0_g1_i1.p1  ORF type:complete len:585 (+),score=143.29 TRINITY_DN30120_c0_g1_i1:54-1808(+)
MDGGVEVVESSDQEADAPPGAPPAAPLCVVCGRETEAEGAHAVRLLPCGHYYGKACVEEHFAGPLKRPCKVCGEMADRGDARPVYVEPAAIQPSERHRATARQIQKAERRRQELAVPMKALPPRRKKQAMIKAHLDVERVHKLLRKHGAGVAPRNTATVASEAGYKRDMTKSCGVRLDTTYTGVDCAARAIVLYAPELLPRLATDSTASASPLDDDEDSPPPGTALPVTQQPSFGAAPASPHVVAVTLSEALGVASVRFVAVGASIVRAGPRGVHVGACGDRVFLFDETSGEEHTVATGVAATALAWGFDLVESERRGSAPSPSPCLAALEGAMRQDGTPWGGQVAVGDAGGRVWIYDIRAPPGTPCAACFQLRCGEVTHLQYAPPTDTAPGVLYAGSGSGVHRLCGSGRHQACLPSMSGFNGLAALTPSAMAIRHTSSCEHVDLLWVYRMWHDRTLLHTSVPLYRGGCADGNGGALPAAADLPMFVLSDVGPDAHRNPNLYAAAVGGTVYTGVLGRGDTAQIVPRKQRKVLGMAWGSGPAPYLAVLTPHDVVVYAHAPGDAARQAQRQGTPFLSGVGKLAMGK